MWGLPKNNLNVLINERFQTRRLSRQKTVAKLIINWDRTLEIIKTDVERKTDEVTTGTRSEEFDNQKQNADADIPQHVHSHFQLQEHLRQVQEDCRGGAHGQS
jgi:hypothetical protein